MQHSLERRTQVTRYWLLARGAELRERVRRVEADLGVGAARTLPADSGDGAISGDGEELLRRIASAALDELHYIRIALKRLDDGTFAICERCEGQIDPERIEAAPYTTCCSACARKE